MRASNSHFMYETTTFQTHLAAVVTKWRQQQSKQNNKQHMTRRVIVVAPGYVSPQRIVNDILNHPDSNVRKYSAIGECYLIIKVNLSLNVSP